MTKNVFAGTWEIAAENGMNKSIARFPDVCMSPPSPPAGPIPIPYPDTSFSNNLKSGSTTVKIGGKGAALAQKSYYKQPVLGDEAATRAFGSNVITHQITGKTYFKAWCMDVKFEGKNVCRHIDITTSNHASDPPATPPAPSTEMQTTKEGTEEAIKNGKCPCCGKALHPWQVDDSDPPKALPTIKEADFYDGIAKNFENKAAEKAKDAALSTVPLSPTSKDLRFCAGIPSPSVADAVQGKAKYYRAQVDRLKELMKANRDCLNVHNPEDVGCGTHFVLPPGQHERVCNDGVKRSKTLAQHCETDYSGGPRHEAIKAWKAANPTRTDITNRSDPAHKTPKAAGGCNSPDNLVPSSVIPPGPCKDIENLQTELHKTVNL